MNVLLINPPLNTSYPTKGVYPMGLGYIAAMLKQAQCEVDVLDVRLYEYDETFIRDFLKRNQGKYRLVGIGGMVTAYRYTKWISHEIKKYNPSSIIVVGGSLCTAGELLLKNSEVDIVCIGEGEKAIVDIVEAICSNRDFIHIPNIMILRDGKIVSTKREDPIDINSIPFPAWDLFDMERYTRESYLVPVNKPSITMITERGCPFGCSFCYRNFGRKIRLRSGDSIVEEIKAVIDRFGIKHIDFIDEIFNVNPTHVAELCKRIIKEDIKVTWRCIGRTDLLDRDLLKLMYEAGCRWIGFGVESGSQEMLNKMNKRQKIEEIEEAIRLSREVGLIVTGTFIIGMPGETEQTIQETREFFRRNRLFNIPFFPVPYPGTTLYNECIKRGLIKDEEAYVISLEKDATELIINLTDIPDSRLIKLRDDLIEEFREFIPSMELRGGVFTVHTDLKVDEVIEKHMSHIVNRFKAIPAVKSIILGGGFGRGEGSVLIDHKGIRPVNDYDIFVVVSDDDTTDYASIGQKIADEIGIRMVDIIPIKYSDLQTLPPTQFNYDLKYGSHHLWGEYVLDLIPAYKEGHVEHEAGKTLLMNRLICAIEAYSERFEEHTMTEEEIFFIVNQTGKVISACVEALLIRDNKYHHSYKERQKIFETNFPERTTLIELNKKATEFKLRPTMYPDFDPLTYWKDSIQEYVKIIGEYLLPHSVSPVNDLMKLLKNSGSQITHNPVERIELMLLLYKVAPDVEKTDILFRACKEYEAFTGTSIPIPDWEILRENTVRLWHEMHHGKDIERLKSDKDIVLLILVDGLRYDYINPIDSPFLYSLCEQNIDGIVRETFAFELRPAFFAGLQPEECDIAHMYCYNPRDSIFRSIDISHGDRNRINLDLRKKADKRGYSLVKYIGSSAEIPLRLLKYFDFSERYHTADPSSISGHKTLFDYLRSDGKKWLWIGYPDGPGTTSEVREEFLKRLTPDLDFIYLHFSELDWAGHEAGPHSERQKHVLKEIDEAIREVYRRLNQTFRSVKGIIFGDHGQVAIRKHIDIEARLKETGLRLEEDYIYFLDSTQARFWFFNDKARQKIMELLQNIPDGKILSEEDYERLHFRFGHNKFGDLIFVVNDGVGIFPNFFQSANPCKGLHGYLPEVKGNWGKLIITGCGVNVSLDTPVEMTSIFPTLLEMLGYKPPTDLKAKSIFKETALDIPHVKFRASVIIPTYNRVEVLKKNIHAIEKQTCPMDDFEVIVVDDGSTDGTWEFLEEYRKHTKLNFRCFRQNNAGPATARNVGIKNALGHLIVLVGDDTIISPNFIKNHIKFHEEWPQFSHACLGFIDWSKDIEINPLMKLITSPEGGYQFNYESIENQDPDNVRWDVFWGSNVSFKRLFSLTHGLFNERFKLAMWEDVELGYRLEKAGLILHYRKECLAYHEHRVDFEKFAERQRMVGWYSHDLHEMGVPAGYFGGPEERIYSKKVLSAIARVLSEITEDYFQNNINLLHRLYIYGLKYATLVGCMERENKLNEDIEGDIGLLLNLASAEQELEEKEKKLKEKDDHISMLTHNLRNRDALISEYKKKNQELLKFVEKIDNVMPALERLLKRLLIESLSADILVEAGEVCFSLGHYESAKHFFQRALEIEPQNSDALNNVGVLNFQQGDYQTARVFFTEALRVNPEHREAITNLALLDKEIISEEIEDYRCKICGSSEVDTIYRVNGQYPGQYKVGRCRNCSIVFLLGDFRHLAGIIKKNSDVRNMAAGLRYRIGKNKVTDLYSAYEEDSRNAFKHYSEIIFRYKNSGKILDIGCGNGYFLSFFDGAYWERWGVDYNEENYKKMLERGNIRAFVGDFNDFNTDIRFDVITMIEYIEHSNNPLSDLRKTYSLLDKEGILLIVTGNVDSEEAQRKGDNWSYFTAVPDHKFFFSPKTLSLLLKKAGFSAIELLSKESEEKILIVAQKQVQ